MSSLIVGRHYDKNMVGNVNTANFEISLFTRYTHKPKHFKSNSININRRFLKFLKMLKRIDNKLGMKPSIVYWSLWASALIIFAIATISLEMQWISSLTKS